MQNISSLTHASNPFEGKRYQSSQFAAYVPDFWLLFPKKPIKEASPTVLEGTDFKALAELGSDRKDYQRAAHQLLQNYAKLRFI